ncbi:DNA cytosine methyltransferase [Knoellia sp. 3-2P3]|uniref:DNA cytosine methyltransferase n=1 Tax=unclassified Knoellia TaxID=2618719 RepID=UPI0023DA5036|nr:DNA cytosine methyltransferase [Knoellia sp. 3-2P3]MDF2092598.1 DNA cytosine methyltransferase [Knoellia sp. 3-2P3]
MPIPVIDVFAGPGGLNEGFSHVLDGEGNQVFKTVTSIEMDPKACDTLKLRAAVRTLRGGSPELPSAYAALLRNLGPNGHVTDFEEASSYFSRPEERAALADVEREVRDFTLGKNARKGAEEIIAAALPAAARSGDEPWVLIGGPPCQAYSLAGRSRRRNDATFADDHKHVLYQEYLHIIREFRPTVFVMENVKGMLSSSHAGSLIFDQIMRDLQTPLRGLEYEVRSLVVPRAFPDAKPSDFVIRAEHYGVPQKRHRVILLGVLRSAGLPPAGTLTASIHPVTVWDAIGGLPKVTSSLSARSLGPNEQRWTDARDRGHSAVEPREDAEKALASVDELLNHGEASPAAERLQQWLLDSKGAVTLHDPRSHMMLDIERYAFLSLSALMGRGSLKVGDLRGKLKPAHRNVDLPNTPFTDRFRVQLPDDSSTTVVSHIAKDGHYYIHPDPMQARSLTVREAARLQTFPDSYLFIGGRTQQYHQVGNAVPPLLAAQIGEVVADLLEP